MCYIMLDMQPDFCHVLPWKIVIIILYSKETGRMEFHNCIRNKYGKCDVPSNTIKRIKDGLQKLDLEVEYYPFQISDNIYWGRVWIDSIRIVCNGKGITPELAEASAYAELAERLSAGLFYPVFEEQVRFNVPGLYNGWKDIFIPTRMIWKILLE
jgi:hypothetical protein